MAIKRCPADVAFSKAVRLSRGMRCENCGRNDGQIECCHIIGRREKTVRWDTLNAVALCHSCHRAFTENPLDFTAWLREHVGEAQLEILSEKRRGIFKATDAERKLIAKHYREQIKLLEAGPHRLESYQ